MRVFESPNAVPSRGMFRIAGKSVTTTLRSLPGLFLLALTWIGVAALVLLVVALPVGVSQALSPILALFVGGILVLLALPFLIFWDATFLASSGTLLASRALDEPAGAVDSLGHGLRRALPFLGSVILTKLLFAIVLLPLGFVGLAASFFWGLGAEGPRPVLLGLAFVLALSLPFLLFVVLHVALRLGFAPMISLFEGLGPVASLERAWSFSRGRVLRLLGYAIIGMLLAGGFGFLAAGGGAALGLMAPDYATAMDIIGGQDPASWGQAGVLLLLVRALATLFLPILAGLFLCFALQSASILLYFDLRRRHEGFGLAGSIGRDFRLELDGADGVIDDPDMPPLVERAEPDLEAEFAYDVDAEVEAAVDTGFEADAETLRAVAPKLETDREAAESNPWATVLAKEAAPALDAGPTRLESSDGSDDEAMDERAGKPIDQMGPEATPDDSPATHASERTGSASRYDESGATRMHRLIEMLPESEPLPEAGSRPGFVKRLLAWLPAPMPESSAADEAAAAPSPVPPADAVERKDDERV
jgi:hypothetical protein